MQTKHKIYIAGLMCQIVMFFRRIFSTSYNVLVKRKGINWSLDLREGIDFSIFLLGCFEKSTLNAYSKLIGKNAVVLDIGANCGSHTLQFAKLVGQNGKVLAFEPTLFAYQKMIKNISLNPELKSRILPMQMLLCSPSNRELVPELYSSWPISANTDVLHEKHCGLSKTTSGAIAKTLDEVIAEMNLSKIDFVKLDVDGYEADILEGALKTLKTYKPTILMEFAPWLFDDKKLSFENMLKNIDTLGYQINYINSEKSIPPSAPYIRNLIKDGASLNVLLKSKR